MVVDIVIKDGQIVFPSGIMRAGIAVDKGKIVALSLESQLPDAHKTIDAKGKYVIPGFVDEHDHLQSQFGAGRDTLGGCFKRETKAAAFGGVTTIGQMAPLRPPIQESFEKHREAYESNAVVDAIFHYVLSRWEEIEELPKCPDLGMVTIGELGGYKGYQAEQFRLSYMDDGMMYRVFEIVGKWGPPGRVLLHGENVDVIQLFQERITKEGRKDCAAWTASRPSFCETEKMRCYIELAKAAKCPIGFVHMSLGEDVDIISRAKSEGVDVYGETCPQYLVFTKDSFKAFPSIANVNPPLQEKEDIERLWQGIRDGWVECVATDHSAYTKDQKGNDIMRSYPGVGSTLPTWMPVMLSEGVNKGRITLEKMVEVCCYNPAKYLGILPQKGILNIGSDADIVIVDLKKRAIPKPEDMYSVADFDAYEVLGIELQGWPILTMLRGNIIMENGRVIGKEGAGKYIKRKLF